MVVQKQFLSLNAMDNLMRKAGALRVSDEAKLVLAEVLEEKALVIAQEAKKFAEHAGRKTIKAQDIKLAARS